jgi:hypothetical protein
MPPVLDHELGAIAPDGHVLVPANYAPFAQTRLDGVGLVLGSGR